MLKNKITLQELVKLNEDEAVKHVGFIFEESPWIVREVFRQNKEKLSSSSLEEIHNLMCQIVQAASQVKKLDLIRAHPDLVGRAAKAGTLTPSSTIEQKTAGLDALSQEEVNLFDTLNSSYKSKFEFPFIICVRENKKEAIINGMQTRINNTKEQEIDEALKQIFKIAWLRLSDYVNTAKL